MDTIKLKVTSKVLKQIDVTKNQEQIAITNPTGSLVTSIAEANKRNPIRLEIASAFILTMGDTSAIWRIHNNESKTDFDSLFNLLKNYPDKEFEFICSVNA